MRRSLIASLLFHLAVAAALFVGLPQMGENLPVETPITVEIVSDASEAKPSPLPPKPSPPAQAAPLPQRQAATPAPPPPAPKVEQKPEVKPAPPPPPPPAQAKPEPPPPPKPEPEPKKAEAPKPEPAPKKAEAPKPEPVPEPRKVEAKPPPPKPVKPEPPKPVEAAKPEPKKEEPKKPVEVAKAEPKKEKPPTPPAAKSEDSDFDALLRSVEQTPKRVQAPEKREAKGTVAEAGGTGQPGQAQQAAINPSLLAASISRQITPCWNIPVAAQGIGGLRAELNIVMAPDGSVQSVVPMDAARMSGDPVFRAFAESAVRAVRACSPLKLPPESYQVWRNIIFNFDPSLMAG